MPVTTTETPIVIFAKAAEPGFAKTRLIPVLGRDRAAELQRRLTEHAVDTACRAALGPVELWCAPTESHPAFVRFADRRGITMAAQCEGGLGARMRHAAEKLLATHGRVIMIGTDSPALTADDLAIAAAALNPCHDAVVTPAEDGGYVLLGLRRCDPLLFDGIAWGSHQVMRTTRARLAALAWRWHELPTSWDVDRPADYRRLLASGLLPELEQALG